VIGTRDSRAVPCGNVPSVFSSIATSITVDILRKYLAAAFPCRAPFFPSAPAMGRFFARFLCSIPPEAKGSFLRPDRLSISTKAGFCHPQGRSVAEDGEAVDRSPRRALLVDRGKIGRRPFAHEKSCAAVFGRAPFEVSAVRRIPLLFHRARLPTTGKAIGLYRFVPPSARGSSAVRPVRNRDSAAAARVSSPSAHLADLAEFV